MFPRLREVGFRGRKETGDGIHATEEPISLYPAVKHNFFSEDSAPWLHTFLLGWVVTVLSGVTAYPIDTVKRRMMMTSGERVKYASSVDCLRQIVATEGPRALFRGAAVNVVRGVAGAGVLSGFDHFKKAYTSRRKGRGQSPHRL